MRFLFCAFLIGISVSYAAYAEDFSVGETVLAPWDIGDLYRGQIVDITASGKVQVDIERASFTDKDYMKLSKLVKYIPVEEYTVASYGGLGTSQTFRVGETVLAPWDMGNLYRGRIDDITENGWVRVDIEQASSTDFYYMKASKLVKYETVEDFTVTSYWGFGSSQTFRPGQIVLAPWDRGNPYRGKIEVITKNGWARVDIDEASSTDYYFVKVSELEPIN